MIPTDEEIEKEAKLRAPFYSPQYIAFVEGVEWMRERCGLQWKKPSEEMPPSTTMTMLLCFQDDDARESMRITTGWYDGDMEGEDDRFKCFSDKEMYTVSKLLAWAYIEPPDWLE